MCWGMEYNFLGGRDKILLSHSFREPIVLKVREESNRKSVELKNSCRVEVGLGHLIFARRSIWTVTLIMICVVNYVEELPVGLLYYLKAML